MTMTASNWIETKFKSSKRYPARENERISLTGMSNDTFHIFLSDLVFIAALPFNTYREHGET